jgi:leader peptidase (prepilin peptidase)/N-methyltransferase
MFILGIINQGFTFKGLLLTAVGGLAGFGILIGFYYFGILFSKIMSKIRHQEIEEIAMGFGDVYVACFLGFLVGWPAIVGSIILAVILSGIFSFLYLVILSVIKKYKSFSAIPYTPFLILGAIIVTYLVK